MGIFKNLVDRFFKKESIGEVEKNLEPKGRENVISQHVYQDVTKENSDVCDGMEFVATCQLRTPLFVLKKHGEIYRGEGSPPTYGEPRDGVWLPKLNDKFDFLSEGRTTASDAGHVNPDEYISYAVGLLSIFEADQSIHEKMEKAINYSAGSNVFKGIENKIIKYYKKRDITDVMCLFINIRDRKEYQFNRLGCLTSINGINQDLSNLLENNGIRTISDLKKLDKDDLLKIKGIGKVKAEKILSDLDKYNI